MRRGRRPVFPKVLAATVAVLAAAGPSVVAGTAAATSPTDPESSAPDDTTTASTPDDRLLANRRARLAPDTPIPEVVDAIRSMEGHAVDPIGVLSSFVSVPAPLPTPSGAVVTNADVRIRLNAPYLDDYTETTTLDVTYLVSGTYEDVVTFFSTKMVVAGYQPVDAQDTRDNLGRRRTVTYEFRQPAEPTLEPDAATASSGSTGPAPTGPGEVLTPDRPAPAAEVQIVVWERENEELSVSLEIRTRKDDGTDRMRYASWCDGAPYYAPRLLTGIRAELGSIGTGDVNIGCSYTLDGATDLVAERVTNALPNDVFALDSGAPTAGMVELVREGFDQTWISVSTWGVDEPPVTELTLTMLIYG